MTSQIWSPPWYVSQPLWLIEKKSATVATTWTATITPRASATCRVSASAIRPRATSTGVAAASPRRSRDGPGRPVTGEGCGEPGGSPRSPEAGARGGNTGFPHGSEPQESDGHRFSRYQATVRSIPSRSGIRARKPKSSSARDTSSCRRGWPFGFERVPDDLAVEADQLGDELGEVADRDLHARCRG